MNRSLTEISPEKYRKHKKPRIHEINQLPTFTIQHPTANDILANPVTPTMLKLQNIQNVQKHYQLANNAKVNQNTATFSPVTPNIVLNPVQNTVLTPKSPGSAIISPDLISKLPKLADLPKLGSPQKFIFPPATQNLINVSKNRFYKKSSSHRKEQMRIRAKIHREKQKLEVESVRKKFAEETAISKQLDVLIQKVQNQIHKYYQN